MHVFTGILQLLKVSWPLMLSSASGCIMLFVSRLTLSCYNLQAFNAIATARTAFLTVCIIPFMIVSLTEVLVGQSRGRNKHHKAGPYTWHMLWISGALIPLFIIIGLLAPSFLFKQSPTYQFEVAHFRSFMFLAPLFCISSCLSSFFVGARNTLKAISIMIIGNMLILIGDVVFTLGWYCFPCFGIYGSAIGHAIGLSLQSVILFVLFWNYNKKYNTHDYSLHKRYFIKIINLTGPFALGKCFESLMYFLFYLFCSSSGTDTMMIIGVTNSFYLLVSFLLEGLSRAVSSLCSNLLGEKNDTQAHQIVKSALYIQLFLSSAIGVVILFFFGPFFSLLKYLFLSHQSCAISPALANNIHRSFCYVILYFIADGIGRIYMSFLTAAGDTRFILYAYCLSACFVLALPSYVVMQRWHASADWGWIILTAYATSNALLYAYRYYHDYWTHQYEDEH